MRLQRSTQLGAGILASAMVLGACASGGGAEDGASGDTEKTLSVWFPGNLAPEMAWMNDEIVPAFEEEHGIDLQVEFVDWGDLSTRLSTAFAGGTAPDIFGHGNAAAAGYAANDRVISLDPYLDELGEDEVSDLTFLDQGLVDGEHVIMPLRGFGHLLAYRTDVFEEAGLDPEAPPQTWDELRAAAEALTVRDGGTITRSGVILPADDPTSMTQAFASFLFQAGGSFVDDGGETATWNATEGQEALEFITGLYNGDEPVATGLGEATSGAGAQHPLVTGRAAMAVVDEATLKSIYEQSPDVAETIAVAPPLENAEAAMFGGAGNGLFISADSDVQDEAWEFIQFLLEAENAKAYIETVGGIPARASLAEDPDLSAMPYVAPYMEAAAEFRGNPNLEAWTQVRDVLSPQIEAALRGVTPPADALDAAAAEAAELLSQD